MSGVVRIDWVGVGWVVGLEGWEACLHVLGEDIAGRAAGGVVVGDLDENLEQVLDYILDVICAGVSGLVIGWRPRV